MLVMPKQRQQNDDRQRNAQQPEQRASTKTHANLLSDLIGIETNAWPESSSGMRGRKYLGGVSDHYVGVYCGYALTADLAREWREMADRSGSCHPEDGSP